MVHSGTCRLPNAKADRRRQIGPARIHEVKDAFEHQERTHRTPAGFPQEAMAVSARMPAR